MIQKTLDPKLRHTQLHRHNYDKKSLKNQRVIRIRKSKKERKHNGQKKKKVQKDKQQATTHTLKIK